MWRIIACAALSYDTPHILHTARGMTYFIVLAVRIPVTSGSCLARSWSGGIHSLKELQVGDARP
jgi:hypothetical protein